jgi:hypothetical protein
MLDYENPSEFRDERSRCRVNRIQGFLHPTCLILLLRKVLG